jgi:pyruvate dehydrogenase (quinone)
MIEPKSDTSLLEKARSSYQRWQGRQLELADPAYDGKAKGLLRRKVDNPDLRIRPEVVAAAVDRLAASDAIFTTDTGMSTVWLSRFVRMTGSRRLIGFYNLGSMANARCRRRSVRRASTAAARWSRSAATAACRCCWAT